MAAYEALTLPVFEQRLKSGQYGSATGARRAVGKAHELSEAEKDKARGMIDRYFGASATTAAKAPAAKSAPKATKAKADAGEKPKRGRPKGSGKNQKAAEAAAAQAKAAKSAPAPVQKRVAKSTLSVPALPNPDILRMHRAEDISKLLIESLNAISSAKQHNPDIDVAQPSLGVIALIEGCMPVFRKQVETLQAELGVEAPTKATRATRGTRAAQAFQASLPKSTTRIAPTEGHEEVEGEEEEVGEGEAHAVGNSAEPTFAAPSFAYTRVASQ